MDYWKTSAHRKRGGKTDNDRKWRVKQFALMWSVNFSTWNKKISWTKTLNHEHKHCFKGSIPATMLSRIQNKPPRSLHGVIMCSTISPVQIYLATIYATAVCLLHGLLNPADPPMSQSMWAQAVQLNIVQTHRRLVHIPAEILKPPKRPVCLWEMCKMITLETYSREEKKEYWLGYLFFMTATVWKEMSFPNLKQSACLL